MLSSLLVEQKIQRGKEDADMHYLVNKQVKIIKAYLVDIAFIMLIFVFCLWNLGSLNAGL